LATLKRQRADGTWEFVQVVGQEVGRLSDLKTDDKTSLVNSINEVYDELKEHDSILNEHLTYTMQ